MVSSTRQDKLGLEAGEIKILTIHNKDVNGYERLSSIADTN